MSENEKFEKIMEYEIKQHERISTILRKLDELCSKLDRYIALNQQILMQIRKCNGSIYEKIIQWLIMALVAVALGKIVFLSH